MVGEGHTAIRSRGPLALGLTALLLPVWALAQGVGVTAPERIQVTRFKVQGNTLLSPAQIGAALDGQAGNLSFPALQAVTERLQSAYRRAGWGTVVVNLPVQTLDQGEVTLEVLEGRLARLRVSGNAHFSSESILASLPALAEGRTPSTAELDRQLALGNENPARSVRVSFQPGMQRAAVDATVLVEDQPFARWGLALENTGSSSSGLWRTSARYRHANLWGRDHQLNLFMETAPDRATDVAVLSAGYRVPFYVLGASLDWSAGYSDIRSNSVGTAAGDLMFSGRGHSLGVRWQQHLSSWGEWRHQFGLGLDWRRYRNACTIGELGSDGCGGANAGLDVRPLSLAYSWQRGSQMQGTVQWVAHVLPPGHGADFEAQRQGARLRYQLVRGFVGGQTELDIAWALQWRGAWQWTNDALVSAEQFGLGGVQSVRGYQEREMAGDRGWTWSTELRRALTSGGDATGMTAWHGAVFGELGQVSNRHGVDCLPGRQHCTLAALGVGLAWAPQSSTRLRLSWARAMKAGPQTARGATRLHLSLSHDI